MKKQDLSVMLLLLLYLVIRLPLLIPMDEYMDYDEGTYLMIARFINHGVLPYRDIYAVHPPLYYYLLALWLRVFGDNYIVARSLSVVVGALSILIAYLIGRELRDWKLGVAFSGLLVLDPLMVHMNTVVYHETSIELFTLLSMYYFVRYFKTENPWYAYASLFIAGIGSTSKFTILPYLLALYVTILFSRKRELWGYLTDMANVVLNRKQGTVILMTYVAMTLISISAVMLYPTDLTRLLVIVPGISKITIVGQKFAVALLLIIWGVLTIYVFKASYVHKIFRTLMLIFKDWKTALKLGLAVIIGKLVIEVPLGILVSPDYLNQTYLAQGNRYPPMINIFTLINDILTSLEVRKPEFLYPYAPMLFLLLGYLFVSTRAKVRFRASLKNLTLMNILVYFFVAPVLPNMRFLYPLALVVYLLVLDAVFGIEIERRKALSLAVVAIVLLGVVDYGIVANYPSGRLKIGWAVHSKELRDDLGEYILTNGLKDDAYYSVNPMNTYYLGLKVPPYTLDNFGIFYLAHLNSTYLLDELFDENVSHIIFSTWMYAIKDNDALLKRNYGSLIEKVRKHFVLEFAESYKKGEVMELYRLSRDTHHNISVTSHRGKVMLLTNGTDVAHLYVVSNGTEFNLRTQLLLENGSYIVRQWSENGSVAYTLRVAGDMITLNFTEDTGVVLEFKKDVVLLDNLGNVADGGTTILAPGFSVFIEGARDVKQVDDKKVEVHGKTVILSLAGHLLT